MAKLRLSPALTGHDDLTLISEKVPPSAPRERIATQFEVFFCGPEFLQGIPLEYTPAEGRSH